MKNQLTKEKLAEQLNGNEYGEEITSELEKIANANGLVVVFGASDDLVEFRGAIKNEADVYEGGEVYFYKKNLYLLNDAFQDFEQQNEFLDSLGIQLDLKTIEAVWASPDIGGCWSYKTNIPHATFEILEDGDLYCQGIVFSLDDL